MLTFDNSDTRGTLDPAAAERAALLKALDMGALWQACAALVTRALPCHSCSLMFDIDGYEPRQGRHFLATAVDEAPPVTSLSVSAPYLAANPRVRRYTYSQIASQDTLAAARLQAQNPGPGWREFIHLAFWNDRRLETVLSIRIRAEHQRLSECELAFLDELYPALDASLQRVRLLETERTRYKALEALLLHRLPLAIAVIDEQLDLLYLSPEARRICACWGESAGNGRRLPQAVERALAPSLRGGGGRAEVSVALPGHPQGARLRLEVGAPSELAAHRVHYLLTFAPETGGAPPARLLPLLNRLSPSERKVAALVAQGLRNDDVALRLCRSRKTIESQISSIYRKLDIGNRAQLARLLAG